MDTMDCVPTNGQPLYGNGRLSRTEALLLNPEIYDAFGDVLDENVPYYFYFVFGCACGTDTNIFIPIGLNGMPPAEIIVSTEEYLADPEEPDSVKAQMDPREPKYILFWPSCSNDDCDHTFSVAVPLSAIQHQVLVDQPVPKMLN